MGPSDGIPTRVFTGVRSLPLRDRASLRTLERLALVTEAEAIVALPDSAKRLPEQARTKKPEATAYAPRARLRSKRRCVSAAARKNTSDSVSFIPPPRRRIRRRRDGGQTTPHPTTRSERRVGAKPAKAKPPRMGGTRRWQGASRAGSRPKNDAEPGRPNAGPDNLFGCTDFSPDFSETCDRAEVRGRHIVRVVPDEARS